MNKKSFFDIGVIFDILAYGLLVILFAIIQTTLVPRFNIYDALPDVIIGAIAYLGIYRGEKTAALFGLFAGLCVDGLGNFGVSFLPLFYCMAGFCMGSVGKAAREKARFAAFLVSLPALCFFRTVITFIDCFIKYRQSLDYARFALYTALPEFLSTLIICIPVFLAVRLYELPLIFARKRGWLD